MERWLARLSFSFIIIAAILAYEARQDQRWGWMTALKYLAAAFLLGLGAAGIRARHRGK